MVRAVFRKFHAVVDHPATIGRCSVSRHDQVPGQHADTDHTVRFSDASRFNREDVWVAMFARTIEFSAVDVDDQGLPVKARSASLPRTSSNRGRG